SDRHPRNAAPVLAGEPLVRSGCRQDRGVLQPALEGSQMSGSKNGSADGTPIGIAVIGCGGIGQTHARAAREIPDARLIGVSSRDEAKARKVADLEGCRFTTDPA